MKGIQVVPVVAGCIVKDKKILVALRENSNSPETIGMWEMAGGCVEKYETPQNALVRELEEELGILVYVKDLLHAQINTFSEGVPYLVLFYNCDILCGHGAGEGLVYKWVDPHSTEFRSTLPGAREALNELICRGEYV